MTRYELALKKRPPERFYIESRMVPSYWARIGQADEDEKEEELWIIDRTTGIVKENFHPLFKTDAQKRCREMNKQWKNYLKEQSSRPPLKQGQSSEKSVG
jgi:hypothetical protein